MINFNKTKYNKKDGFTLVETLVALFIFSVSVITTMSVVSGGIANTNYAKNKVISEYLAQEGIEYVKNLRDSSVLYTTDTQTGWNDFIKKLNNAGCTVNGCYFNNDESTFSTNNPIMGITFLECLSGICPDFYYNESTGKYSYTGTNASIFSRKILIQQIDNDDIKIISQVTFKTGLKSSTISFSEDLSNCIE